jgi:hypothetical protein
MDILQMRLANQYLTGPKFSNPQEAVSYFGAVQAQDFPAAKWALGQRIENSTDQMIEKAFNDGLILRTHVMRPTWHFVDSMDIRWMLELTAPRVKSLMAHYNRKLELTDELFGKSNAAIVEALKKHKYLSRRELKKVLESINIKTDVQRLAHIIMWSELDADIISGPRIGKQFTYALFEERVGRKGNKPTRDEAMSKLALKYFISHGPAQLKDFSWWSGLSIKDAQTAQEMVKSKLQEERIGDKSYWLSTDSQIPKQNVQSAFLLSIYDEYIIAYKDRSDLSEKRDIERMIASGNALTAVIILDGKVAGSWKRSLKKGRIEIQLNPFRKLESKAKDALETEVRRYGKFWGMPAVIV